MILFSCQLCGLRLQVQDEYAGRRSSCPTCKKSVVIPSTNTAPVEVPLAELVSEQPSSLSRVGFDPGVTLDSADTNVGRPVREVLHRGGSGQRYIIDSEIARGGMGTVLRAVDCDIRREVAVKYLLDQADPGKKMRFIEEAQVTGQLEHPNIVPIHELGLDAEKRLFFSMKMVKGRSLKQVLALLHQGGREAEKEYTLPRLLNILVSVCNALSYAHARGVVHRDLKPANIMLGDFGEVYVMDWGLAKLLASGGRKQPESGEDTGGLHPPLGGVVSTTREDIADLTQEGAVLGTPVYMAPEQATGRVHDIDCRTDIYALGAILYEILTLLPPIDRKGGFNAIVLRAASGEITPPEQRTPERAGKIPPELSAVAMKALSLDMGKRYFRVETFRQDIERFLEGHSVSARADNVKELAWKLVKRHRGVSIAATMALLIIAVLLLIGFQTNRQARLKAEENYRSYQAEQAAKQEQARKAVPAFVDAARLSIERRKFANALTQIDIALDAAPDHADARLLKTQLLLVEQDFERAAKELEVCRKQRPDDDGLRKLTWWCLRAKRDDPATLLGLAAVFEEQRAYGLADGMLQSLGSNAVEAREKLLALYRKRIEAIHKGWGNQLSVDTSGRYVFSIQSFSLVDLEFLRGIPLSILRFDRCPGIRDLGPLEGMQLEEFEMGSSHLVRDLSPLKGMPLRRLNLVNCVSIKDLTPLRGLPLTHLYLIGLIALDDLSPLQGMPLVELKFHGSPVEDLTPLEKMPLITLSLYGCDKVRSLEPLRHASLTYLNLFECRQIEDLSPLRGQPVRELDLTNVDRIRDLSPLRDMPLTSLIAHGRFKFRDLSFLQGKKLTKLDLWGWDQLEDLTALENMPITLLNLDQCKKVHDLRPLRGMPLRQLGLFECDLIKDLTLLDGMNLDSIHLSPRNIEKGMDVLRRMSRLNRITIGVNSNNPSYITPEFWKKYDAGEFKK